MSTTFPYQLKETPFGRVVDPTINLPVSTWYGWRSFKFIVDSGADVSLVPRSIADLVGIDLAEANRLRSFGIEGSGVDVLQGNLTVKIGACELELPCLFSSREDSPTLLGRAGLFDHFSIVFDNQKRKIVFKPIK